MKRKGFFAALLCALLLGTLLPAAFAAEEAEEAAALAEDAGVSASEGFAVSVECSEGGTAHLTGGRERYDAGDKFGFIRATIDFALERDEIRPQLAEYIKKLAETL